jgi:hypothetical protein
MSVKTVGLVLKGSVLICILIPLLMMLIVKTGKYEGDVNGLFVYVFILFIFTFIFDVIFVFMASVRCDHEGCGERMHRAWIKEGGFRLTYKCDRCGYTYDTNFTFGGDSYN